MFGNNTALANGLKAADGWAALVAHDSNADGVIDAADEKFNELRVWVDADADGVTDAGELHTLADKRITSINLSHDGTSVLQNGNLLQGFGSYTTSDGASHEVVDAWLQTSNVVKLSGTDVNLDLTLANAPSSLPHFSALDMTGAGNNAIKLDLASVLNVTAGTGGDNPTTLDVNEAKMLVVSGDAGDTLQLLDGNQWAQTAQGLSVAMLSDTYGSNYNYASNHTYAQYNYNGATLFVDELMLKTNG